MREIPEQCWDKQSYCWHMVHWTAPRRLEYALWQTGQGYVGGPGFCSISPAKRIREWRSGEVSRSHLQKMLGFWLRLPCIVWASARAARWPCPVPEGREQGRWRGSAPGVDVLTSSSSPPDAPPPRAGPLREWLVCGTCCRPMCLAVAPWALLRALWTYICLQRA